MSTAVFVQYRNSDQELFSFEDGTTLYDIMLKIDFAKGFDKIESFLVSTTEGDYKQERLEEELSYMV